jgi:hypothetical protein
MADLVYEAMPREQLVVLNVSQGGARLLSAGPLPPAECVAVELYRYGNGPRCRRAGRLVSRKTGRRGGCAVSVCFDAELRPEELDALMGYPPRPGPPDEPPPVTAP